MASWQIAIAFGMAALALSTIHAIFLEVRSIRRMMNADREISNEIRPYED